MWTWLQTGTMIAPDGERSPGYSGKGEHKNVPESQTIQDWGPIPCGVYRIGDPYDSKTHGPFVLPLTPDAANEMFGRHSFLIHGDSVVNPGTASEGCIILGRAVRNKIAQSGDRELHVLAKLPDVAVDPGMETE